ncbi:hypothetical protein HQ576_19010, partial [bacterium]|nr:hypothetical protein [bacterium]
MRPPRLLASALFLIATAWLNSSGATLPENIARKATAWASSEHNHLYLAKLAIDGKIPAAGSHSADCGAAWCVLKAKSGDRADFSLEWPQPVAVADIVYYGRTAWFMNECWKDYELYLDDAKAPALKGTFRMLHGPQVVSIAPTKLKKITFKFLNSYGGFNPGALEFEVYGSRLTKRQVKELKRKLNPALGNVAGIGEVDADNLRALIRELQELHGERYAQAGEHRARLEKLAKAPDAEEELAELQREVLLFDVDKTLAIKRHEIHASHVYTYHYEGFRPGGGLYVVSLKNPDAPPTLLVETLTGQILDCDLSYDGTTALFSWRRKADEGYHLWTVNVDGTGLKQLTDGVRHDYNACWLPDGGIAFLCTQSPQFAYCWHAPVGVVHRMNADGTGIQRL